MGEGIIWSKSVILDCQYRPLRIISPQNKNTWTKKNFEKNIFLGRQAEKFDFDLPLKIQFLQIFKITIQNYQVLEELTRWEILY